MGPLTSRFTAASCKTGPFWASPLKAESKLSTRKRLAGTLTAQVTACANQFTALKTRSWPHAPGSDAVPPRGAGQHRHGLAGGYTRRADYGYGRPGDADGDGISGRANFVWDVRNGKLALGRFGWKANQPSVEQQVAGAFLGDIGITSSPFPDENCPKAQAACRQAPNGGRPEIADSRLEKVTIYTQTLAVPAMRNTEDKEVQQGARLFVQSNCSLCHTPRHETGSTHPLEPLRGQTIFPYTDLLLHDMGEGLADHRPDGQATGTEWRTPPLWGIGLVETVNGHTMFLHDGRARSLEEAILWHGGEAEESRNRFMGLTLEERNALIKFLESL